MRFRYRSEDEMKDSGVEWLGKIPENWAYTKLKMLTNHIGRGKSPDYVEKSMVKVINQACIYWDSFKFDNVKYQNKDINYDSGKVYKGDLLINSTGTGTLGRARNFNEDGEYIVDSHVTRVRCNDMNYSLYLGYLIRTELYQRLIYSTMVTGSTNQIELSREGLRNMIVPNMTNEELKMIIRFLDKKTAQFDTIISKKETLIQTLEEAKKSLISEVVTGKVKVVKTSDGYELMDRKKEEMKDSGVEWLGEVPSDWDLERGKRLFYNSNEKGNESNVLLSATQDRGVIPKSLVEGAVQNKEDTDFTNFKLVKKYDFIISLRSFQGGFEMSEYDDGIITPAYSVLRAKIEVYPYYYKLLLKEQGFIGKINSLTVGIRDGKNIKYEDFANVILTVPCIEEQELIGNCLKEKVREFSMLIDSTMKQIQKLKEAKQALISEAVTGKIEILD